MRARQSKRFYAWTFSHKGLTRWADSGPTLRRLWANLGRLWADSGLTLDYFGPTLGRHHPTLVWRRHPTFVG